MFCSISWSEYLTFIAISSLIWYAFVFYTYYRHEILQKTKSSQTASNLAMNFSYIPLKEEVASIDHGEYQPRQVSEDHSQIVQSFTDEVVAYLEQAAKDDTPKNDLLHSISVIANKYSSLSQSEYKESLEQFVITQIEMNCAVFLSENEVSRIWSGV